MAKTNRRQHGEGSLYQRTGDGRWTAVVDLGWKGGRRDRRYFYGAAPEEAKAGRDDFLDKRRDGFILPKGRPPTLGEWAHHWLHEIIRDQVRPRTWEGYRSKVELHIIPYFIRTPMTSENVDEALVREFKGHLQKLDGQGPRRKGRLSAKTIGDIHRLLSQIVKCAVIEGRLSRNPVSNVHPPPVEREEPMPPEEDEVQAILLACEDRRTGPRWITGLATGTRQGEALGLLWPYIDLDDLDTASVRIEWELARLPWQHGCENPHACGAAKHRYPCPKACPKAARTSGRPHVCITAQDKRLCPPGCTGHAASCPERHSGGLLLERPKSQKSVRDIPIDRNTAQWLRHQRQAQLEERLALGPAWTGWAHRCDRQPRRRDIVCPDCRIPFQADALVFTQPGGHPVDPRADWEDWSSLLRSCGLDHYGTHAPRHGFATTLLEGGTDIRVVQEVMGHATPDFTRRTYQHVRTKLKRDAADVISQRMWGEAR